MLPVRNHYNPNWLRFKQTKLLWWSRTGCKHRPKMTYNNQCKTTKHAQWQKDACHGQTRNIGISTLTKAIIIVFHCPDVTKELHNCVQAVVPKGQYRKAILPEFYPHPVLSCPNMQDDPFWSSLRDAAPKTSHPKALQAVIVPFLIKALFQEDCHLTPLSETGQIQPFC